MYFEKEITIAIIEGRIIIELERGISDRQYRIYDSVPKAIDFLKDRLKLRFTESKRQVAKRKYK